MEHQPPPKVKSGDRYQNYDPVETGRPRALWEEESERAVRRKEKPSRPAPPHSPSDRERRRDRQRKEHWEPEWEQRQGREERRDHRERQGGRDWDRGPGHSWDPDGQRQRDRERARARSRDRDLDARERPRDGRGSWEEEEEERDDRRERRAARGRHRVPSGPGDVFEEEQRRDEAKGRQYWDGGEMERRHVDSHLMEETGTAESPAHSTLLCLLLGSAGALVWFCWSCFWKISGGGFSFTLKPQIKKRLTVELICGASKWWILICLFVCLLLECRGCAAAPNQTLRRKAGRWQRGPAVHS